MDKSDQIFKGKVYVIIGNIGRLVESSLQTYQHNVKKWNGEFVGVSRANRFKTIQQLRNHNYFNDMWTFGVISKFEELIFKNE